MRVALCLYGHFRTFDQCWPTIKQHIVDPYNADIFAQSWLDSFGTFQSPITSEGNPYTHIGYDPASIPVPLTYVQTIIDTINPVDIQLDHYYLHDKRFEDLVNKYSEFHHPDPKHRPKGVFSLNWTRHCVIEMKKRYELLHNFKYDYVIMTRYDIYHSVPIVLTAQDPNVLGVSDMHQVDDLIGDIWVGGASHLIDIWGEQFNGIDELAQTGTLNLGPHPWQRAWFDHKQVPWVYRNDLGLWIAR